MTAFSDPYVLRCSRSAAEHAAANLHMELARGVASLRAIACSAPLLGLFGTVVMLRSELRSAPGCSYGDCAGGVAETFVPFALSLPVAVFASGGFHYLRQQIKRLDLEMHIGMLNILDHLGRQLFTRQRRHSGISG